eukprot:scaffold185778_cov17-Tisochrysis_lutea.AAC.1
MKQRHSEATGIKTQAREQWLIAWASDGAAVVCQCKQQRSCCCSLVSKQTEVWQCNKHRGCSKCLLTTKHTPGGHEDASTTKTRLKASMWMHRKANNVLLEQLFKYGT